MGSSPHKLAAPPQIETSREMAERIWREQFDEEERRDQKALARMVLEDHAGEGNITGGKDRAETRAPRPRRSAVTKSPKESVRRRKGSSVPRIPPSKA
jgi:hypothetical protein